MLPFPVLSAGEIFALNPTRFVVRCRHCRRIILSDIPRIGSRESDALVSHLKDCQPGSAAREEQRWREEMGPLLERFDVTRSREIAP